MVAAKAGAARRRGPQGPAATILIGIGAATLLLRCAGPSAEGPPPPNVIFLLADDQAHDSLSAAGHPLLSTPNLDRLATEGVHFANAFATTALCSPSRASFYTGQYARTHGVLHNALPLPDQAELFPGLLQAAGWDTAFIGKWHIGHHTVRDLTWFDHTLTYKSQGRYLDNVFRSGDELVETEGFVDDVVTDFALEFIERERDGPFLLCVGFKSTHRPRTPAPRHAELFAETEFETPPNYASLPPFPRRTEWAELSRRAGERVSDRPDEDWAEDYGERWPMVLTRDQSESRRDYLRLVTALDENVGRILDRLDELGLADDTLVIYASDHGYLEQEHGLNGKGTAYESSMRTMLLMRYPRLDQRGSLEQLALSIDVAPTVLDLAGLPIPDGMQGRSLRPLLQRGTATDGWRTDLLYEFFQGRMYGGLPTTLAVRDERFKLIVYPGYPKWTQLFDVAGDPHEMTNLAQSREHAKTRSRLHQRLMELQRELGPVADHNPQGGGATAGDSGR